MLSFVIFNYSHKIRNKGKYLKFKKMTFKKCKI